MPRRRKTTSGTRFAMARILSTKVLIYCFGFFLLYLSLPTLIGDWNLSTAIQNEELKQKQIETKDLRDAAEEKSERRDHWTALNGNLTNILGDILVVVYFLALGFGGIVILFGLASLRGRQHENESIEIEIENKQRYILLDQGARYDTLTGETIFPNGQVIPSRFTPAKLVMQGQSQRIGALSDTGQKWNSALGKTAIGAWAARDVAQPLTELPEQQQTDQPKAIEGSYNIVERDGTVTDFLRSAGKDRIYLGFTGEKRGYLPIDLKENYHFIIAGRSGYGKSWLTMLMLAQLNRAGVHIAVFDCEKELADYRPMINAGAIEGYEVDTDNLERHFGSIGLFAKYRRGLLREAEAKDAQQYERKTGKPMKRHCFLIEELGAMGLRVQSEGKEAVKAFEASAKTLAWLICWVRQVNIHLIITTQAIRPEFFERETRANATILSFQLDGHADKSLGVSAAIKTLGRGQFISTDTPRGADGLDVVWQTPHSQRDEDGISNLFKVQTSPSYLDFIDIEGLEDPEEPQTRNDPVNDGFNRVMEPNIPRKEGYSDHNPLYNPDQGYDDPPITRHNSPHNPPHNPPNAAAKGFDTDSIDWVSVGRMTAKDRQQHLKDNLPKLVGPIEDDWQAEYLADLYNRLDGNRSDLCFALWGSKGGTGERNRWEWLDDAIGDWLDTEGDQGE